MDLCFFFLPQIFSEAAVARIGKHSEKICSVFGGLLISIILHPRKWEGYYAYSPIVGGKLCLLIGVRILPLLRSRHNVPPTSV
jgi:hypothetical protein